MASEDKRQAALRHAADVKKLHADPANLVIYTDGSLLGANAGAGAFFLHKGRSVGAIARGLGEGGDVYDGEMLALVEAMRSASELAHRADIKATNIHFFADNEAAVARIASLSPAPGQYLSCMFLALALPFLALNPPHSISVSWVPGHEGLRGQEASDKLAKAGTRRQPSLPVSMSMTRARRDVSLQLLSDWRSDWLSDVVHDRFAPANRFPPSTRPSPRLRMLDKPSLARLVQCRSGHAFTGEYYRAINKPERGFACTCGVPLQTRDHLLVGCPDLERYRAPLRGVSPQLVVADLLGTHEGLAATVMFIRSSGAFARPLSLDIAEDNA